MSDHSAIEWTDATWNPVRGCSRVSTGCGGPNHQGGCYAEKIAARFSGPGQPFHGFAERTEHGGRWTGKMALVEEKLNEPLRWKTPRKVFVNSMSDLFHENLPDDAILRVLDVVRRCSYDGGSNIGRIGGGSGEHTFQLLTKRSGRMMNFMRRLRFNQKASLNECALYLSDDAARPIVMKNLWLGVSVENQAAANERIPHLHATPAAVRFISAEPSLGPINLNAVPCIPDCDDPNDPLWKGFNLDWVIVGGESGPNARPMHPEWARSLRDQCAAAGVPFFFKQWGSWHPINIDDLASEEIESDEIEGKIGGFADQPMRRTGKKAAGRLLDAAVRADEVMMVRLEAQAIRAVARVAKNFDLEINAVKLRTRAEARLGEMLEQGEKDGIITGHGGKRGQDSSTESCPATLADIGVDRKLSANARKLNSIGARAVNALLDRMERESRERGRLAVNVISGELSRRNSESRRQLARDLSDASVPLSPTGRLFPVVYADPAWSRKAGIGNRAYENHYGTMSWDDILAMPVAKRVLPHAWLFLWIPRAHLLALHPVEIVTPLGRTTVKMPLAWAVAQAWGFDAYSTCAIWTKTDEERPDDHGTGLIFWDQDEILCLFKRGRGLPMPDGTEKVGSNFRARAEGHSAKPTYFRDVINRMTGSVPVLELFAREDDDHVLPSNFFTWGNQSKGTADLCDEPFNPATGEIREAAE